MIIDYLVNSKPLNPNPTLFIHVKVSIKFKYTFNQGFKGFILTLYKTL